jgi:hypothetical protein
MLLADEQHAERDEKTDAEPWRPAHSGGRSRPGPGSAPTTPAAAVTAATAAAATATAGAAAQEHHSDQGAALPAHHFPALLRRLSAGNYTDTPPSPIPTRILITIQAVLRIRIRRIHMFLGLLDPDPSFIKQN